MRHGNKLRRGHLAGNRFSIRIRDVEPTLVVRAKRTLDRLLVTGVPNYLGVQRFGYRGDNHELGRFLLQGNYEAMIRQMLGKPQPYESDDLQQARAAFDNGEINRCLELWPRRLRHERQALDALRQGRSFEQAVRAIAPMQLDFLVSAAQSAVFNAVLHHRITGADSPGIGQLIEGDLAFKHDNGSVFAVDAETAAIENAAEGRAARFEVSPSGPMWGAGMTRPAGAVLGWEQAALACVGLSEADFAEGNRMASTGVRRSLRIALTDADVSGGVDEYGGYVRLVFDLPRGAFATTVLREIMKADGHSTSDPAEESENV
jgi:tRNA pseudouridine13 synthase